MKIKLLNDGGVWGMDNVKFPTIVEANNYYDYGFDVLGSELIRVGADPEMTEHDFDYFFTLEECEIVDE